MRLVLGLLAASLVGADSPAGHDAPSITYDVKLLEMKGLEWRSAFYAELQPVARRGSTTVWTAPHATVVKLAERAGKTISAPHVTGFPGVTASIFSNRTRPVITEPGLYADGPVNRVLHVALAPKVENATEGYAVKVSGRKLDQGVLAQLKIEDRQLIAVHDVALAAPADGVKPASGENAPANAKIQVPEIAQAEVAGEWLIPNGGALVVSLGVRTAADAGGKAVVSERLAVVEARPAAEAGSTVLPTRLPTFSAPAVPFIVGTVNGTISRRRPSGVAMPAPALPSRSLPLALNVHGLPEPLPPLPDDDHTPPTVLPGSSEPCATPQTKGEPVGDPIPAKPAAEPRDPASKRASYTAEPDRCDVVGCCDFVEAAAPAPPKVGKATAEPAQTPTQGKTFTFRVPVNADLVIEVHASAKPLPVASAPAPPTVNSLKRD